MIDHYDTQIRILPGGSWAQAAIIDVQVRLNSRTISSSTGITHQGPLKPAAALLHVSTTVRLLISVLVRINYK